MANAAQRTTVWGESANLDGDQFPKLREYPFDTDPKARANTGPATWSTTVPLGHNSPTHQARQNDPALLMLPQASSSLGSWYPRRQWQFLQRDPVGIFTEASALCANSSTVDCDRH